MRRVWPETKLGEVLWRSTRLAPIEREKIYKQITVRMHNRGLELRGQMKGEDLLGSRQFLVSGGQFLVARIGAGNGAVGLVPSELEGAVVTCDFWPFECDRRKLLPEFLELYARTRTFKLACKDASSGTTRVRLQANGFLRISIPVPPLGEQRRVVSQVRDIVARIEDARRVRQQAIVYAGALRAAAMRRVFRFRGECREVALEKVCSAIIDNLHSNPVYAEEGVPCVRSPDVGWGKLQLEGARRTSEEEYRRRTVRGAPAKDDIVLVREGGGTGKAAIVEEGQRFSLGQRVMLLRPDRGLVQPNFFLYQILSPAIYDEQILPLLKGSASPHLNIATLRKFRFLLPSFPEQNLVVAFLDDLQTRVDLLKCFQMEAAAELEALLPCVLDKAFKGEL